MSGVLAYDQQAEEAAVGAALLSNAVIEPLLAEGLRPEHFGRGSLGKVWQAIMALSERQTCVDSVTVAAEIDRLGGVPGKRNGEVVKFLDRLHAAPPSITAARTYAERVITLAEWRSKQQAAMELAAAAEARDQEAWAKGMGTLDRGVRERRMESLSPQQWASVVWEYLQREKGEGDIPLPFGALTDAMGGGLQAGEVFLVAGWTGHGKSIFVDQMLDQAAKHDYRCHLYMTEMTAAQRGLRYLARKTGIPYGKLRARGLDPGQFSTVTDELARLPYGVTIASDWDMDDVVRDALRARYDVVAIDLIHGFHYQDERELDRLSKAAQRLARVSTTRVDHRGTLVILVAHLNETQMQGQRSAARPKPGMHSIKGASSLKQDADFVCFVWQQDDDMGMPTATGSVWLPKARSGDRAGVDVVLNERRLRFDLLASETM